MSLHGIYYLESLHLGPIWRNNTSVIEGPAHNPILFSGMALFKQVMKQVRIIKWIWIIERGGEREGEYLIIGGGGYIHMGLGKKLVRAILPPGHWRHRLGLERGRGVGLGGFGG